MQKPFFEEYYSWWDIDFYNAANVAEMGEHATIERLVSDVEPQLTQVARKAKESGYDSFCIKECVEVRKDYSVDDFL